MFDCSHKGMFLFWLSLFLFCMVFTPEQTVQTDADMKSEILNLIDDMSEVIAYTLDVRKYSDYSRLHGVIKDLGELAKEVNTFVDKYNSSNQASKWWFYYCLIEC